MTTKKMCAEIELTNLTLDIDIDRKLSITEQETRRDPALYRFFVLCHLPGSFLLIHPWSFTLFSHSFTLLDWCRPARCPWWSSPVPTRSTVPGRPSCGALWHRTTSKRWVPFLSLRPAQSCFAALFLASKKERKQRVF